MDAHMEIIGQALRELIGQGQLSHDDNAKLYDIIMEKDEVFGWLELVCENMGLYLHHMSRCFYVSPIPGTKAFCYSNEELRRALKYNYRNEDLYTALFIIAVIVTEFFPEAGREQAVSFLRLNDIIRISDERIESLKNWVDLEKTSYDNAYNFEIVVKRWLELPMTLVNRKSLDEIKVTGRDSKLQIVNTTLKFLQEQQLIHIPEDTSQDKYIYITERFTATVYNIYRNENAQANIYNLIDGLKQEVDDNA